MKYAFINRHRRVWPISVQCRVLQASVAGYHEHFVRRASAAQRRHLSDDALLVFSRQVVCWSLREDMTRDIVIDALRMAWFKRHPRKQAGLMFHSDRGSHHACSWTP